MASGAIPALPKQSWTNWVVERHNTTVGWAAHKLSIDPKTTSTVSKVMNVVKAILFSPLTLIVGPIVSGIKNVAVKGYDGLTTRLHNCWNYCKGSSKPSEESAVKEPPKKKGIFG